MRQIETDYLEGGVQFGKRNLIRQGHSPFSILHSLQAGKLNQPSSCKGMEKSEWRMPITQRLRVARNSAHSSDHLS
jgi:hypothetical protein